GLRSKVDYIRYGHTAANDDNGIIYIFGGMDETLLVRDDLLIDIKKTKPWLLQTVGGPKAPEGRAFHTATLLPDKTMLIIW
ncbi:hypothetical protein BGZ65_000792, partial [Modicella reniformis]